MEDYNFWEKRNFIQQLKNIIYMKLRVSWNNNFEAIFINGRIIKFPFKI